MKSFQVKFQRASLQIHDDKDFDLPKDWKTAFPTGKGYLCIPTLPDHMGDLTLDLYEKQKDLSETGLKKRYSGKISCPSGTLAVGTGLPSDITKITFGQPGIKNVEVWTNRADDQPTHIAICLFE